MVVAFGWMTYHFEERGPEILSLDKVNYLFLDVFMRVAQLDTSKLESSN